MNHRTRWHLLLTAFLVAALLFLATRLYASTVGRVGYSGIDGGQTCTVCHGGGTAPTVAITGPTTVLPGATNFYHLTVAGGPAETGGLNVAGDRGTLLNGAHTRLESGELTHAWPQPFAGSEVAFGFAWTAPSTTTTGTLYGAGLSSDNQGNTDGDGVGTTVFMALIMNNQATPDSLRLTKIAEAAGPTDLQNAGDGRLFIMEQAGLIRIFDGTQLLSTPFLDITGRVDDSGNEMGLLGLAFHPDYASNGSFFVNYTTSANGSRQTRVSRFSVDGGNPDLADSAGEQVLLEFDQPNTNHNGGALHFGPDGYLYVAVGDGGSSNDPAEVSQDPTSILGNLLRLDVDGSEGNPPDCDLSGNGNYRIPAGNPFADGAGGNCDEIWAIGLRNPWRFSFDALTGDLWIADVGQWAWEEVDFEPAGSSGGRNYGWDCYEGNHSNPNDPAPVCSSTPSTAFDFPVHEYAHNNGRCSITGGYVYRGNALPGLRGHYLFADFCTGELWSLSGSPSSPTLTTFSTVGNLLSLPRTFGRDANGELYVAGDSAVYRLEDPEAAPVTPTLTISPYLADHATLSWDHSATTCSYEVYESTHPYLEEGTSLLHVLQDAGSIYIVPFVAGESAANRFFSVRALNCSALSYADSAPVGAFSFALLPGT